MDPRSFLVYLSILIVACSFSVIPVSAGYCGYGLTLCEGQVSSHTVVSGCSLVPGGDHIASPLIRVLATKSPLFRNGTATGTALFNQGSGTSSKPLAAPGFRESTALMAPLKTSVPQTGTIPSVNPSPTTIKPTITPSPAKFPIPATTGTPLLKTNMFAASQSSLPKIPFPPLNSIPSQPDVHATPDYVTDNTKTIEQRIFYYTNIERAKAGKISYVYDSKLSDIGREDAVDMAARNFFDHINPDGESPTDRAERHGYPVEKDYGTYYRIGVGENIALVQHIQGTPDEIAQYIVNAWMNSPDHRENILDLNGADYTNLGVGVAYDPVNDKYLAVQEFF
jgi:uncharacterized protein YkwD